MLTHVLALFPPGQLDALAEKVNHYDFDEALVQLQIVVAELGDGASMRARPGGC